MSINTPEEFIPFEHQNLEYINGSLNLARQQRQSDSLEGVIAATVIYTNLVEYLANNLLENLQQMIFLITYRGLHGVFFIKGSNTKKKSPKTLGQLKNLLSNYEFPDNASLILLLQKFAEARNAIFHRLLTIPKDELQGGIVDKQITNLHNMAEEILDKYNTITKGITKIFYNVTTPQLKQEALTRDQIQSKIESQIKSLSEQISALQVQLTELNKIKEKDKNGTKQKVEELIKK